MDYRQLYNKYHSRMTKEGILKAFVVALIIACAASGIIALVTWIVGFDAGLWIALGALIGITCAMMPVLYFTVFRPTELTVAKRLDSLGLEERAITMLELKNDESPIACMQRRDTVSTIATAASAVGGKMIRFKMPLSAIIAAAVVGDVCLGTIAVAGLGAFGVIPSGKSVFAEAFAGPPSEYSVGYGVDDNCDGSAELTFGNSEQTVKSGDSTGEVVYTAADYSYFLKWIDAYGDEYFDGPSRQEFNVNENLAFKAYFDIVAGAKDDFDLDRKFTSNGTSGGSGGSGGSGNPGNEDIELNAYDNIINGTIKYTQEYDLYYQAAMNYLANNELSAEERAMIESYFNILK